MYTYNGGSYFNSFFTHGLPWKCHVYPTKVLPTYIADWSVCVHKGRQQSCQIPVLNPWKLAEQKHRRAKSSCLLGWLLGRSFLYGLAPNRFGHCRLSRLLSWPSRQLSKGTYCIFQPLQYRYHFNPDSLHLRRFVKNEVGSPGLNFWRWRFNRWKTWFLLETFRKKLVKEAFARPKDCRSDLHHLEWVAEQLLILKLKPKYRSLSIETTTDSQKNPNYSPCVL